MTRYERRVAKITLVDFLVSFRVNSWIVVLLEKDDPRNNTNGMNWSDPILTHSRSAANGKWPTQTERANALLTC